jgi:hypothetical protein
MSKVKTKTKKSQIIINILEGTMAEEKKEEQAQTPVEEKAPEAKAEESTQAEDKAAEQVAEKKDEPAEQEKAEETPAAPVKKKINRMTLSEVKAKLKDISEHQGGLESRYARSLLERKAYLESKK